MAGKLQIMIVGDASSAKKAFAETGVAAEETGLKVERAGMMMKEAAVATLKAFAPVVASFAAAEFAKGAIEGAERLRKAQESLATAITRTGGSVEKMMPQFDATAKAAAQFGISQEEATRGLARATLITGNAASAQKVYQEALVLSKATGKDFTAVLVAAAKAADGNISGLKRFGVEVSKTSTLQDQFNTVMKTYGGQAEANTTASQQLSANFQNLSASVGSVLLPAFNAIIVAINNIVTWFSSPAVTGAVSGFVSNIKAGLQPAIDWVQANWPKIKNVIQKTMDDIKAVTQAALSAAEAFWRTFGGTITAVIKNAVDTIEGVLKGIAKILKGVAEVIDGIIHGRWHEVWNGLKAIVDGAINAALAVVKGAAKEFLILGEALAQALIKGLLAVLKSIGAEITNAFGSAWKALRSLAGTAASLGYQVGVALIQGMINGIGAMVGSLVSAAVSAAKSAFDAAKHFLHIGSPSRLFADEIGKPIGQGIIVGFQQAIAGFGDIVTGAVSPPALSGFGSVALSNNPTGALFAGGQGRAGVTIQSLVVQGWVGNDQDLARRLNEEFQRSYSRGA